MSESTSDQIATRSLPAGFAFPSPVEAAWRITCLVIAVLVCRLCAALSMQLGLCVATAVALALPGLALAQICGLRRRLDAAEMLGVIPITGLAAWSLPLALAMLVHAPFEWVLVLVLLASTLVIRWDLRALLRHPPREPLAVLMGAALVALVSAQWQPALTGDALYHAGVIRRMIALDGLSLDGLSVYWHGHPHAGYAFPLLHATQAAAIRLLGVDASVAYTNLTPAFAFFVPVAVYGAGRALANRPVAAAAAVFASWDILTRIIAGLVKQPPFFTFTVLFPAIIILLAMGYRHRQQRIWWWWTVIAAAEVAVLHPTYSVVLAPMLIAVALLWPRAWPMVAGAAVVTIAIDAWIYFVAIHGGDRTVAYPGTPDQFISLDGHSLASSGQVILAHRVELLPALLAAVVILFRARSSRHLAAALMAAMMALVAVPGVGAVLTAGIAGGQVERFWNALPWMYLSAIVVAATVGWLHSRRALVLSAIVIALGSVALEHAGWLWGAAGPRAAGWPPRFLHHAVWVLTVPDLLTVTLAIAGVVGLAVRAFDRDRSLRAPPAPPAMAPVALLLLAVMTGPLVRDLPRISSTIRHGSAEQGPANLISPGAVSYLNHHTRTPFPVVLAPWDGPADGLAYQIVGKSNVYTVALNEPHTRATPRDHPTQRRAEVTTFFAPGTSEQVRQAILHNQNVDYVVFDERSGSPEVLAQLRADPTLSEVYSDPADTPPQYGRVVIFERER